MDSRVKSALNVLTHKSKRNVLSLDQLVEPQCPTSGLICKVLQRKHPPPGAVDSAIILLDEVLPRIINHIQSSLIPSMVNSIGPWPCVVRVLPVLQVSTLLVGGASIPPLREPHQLYVICFLS